MYWMESGCLLLRLPPRNEISLLFLRVDCSHIDLRFYIDPIFWEDNREENHKDAESNPFLGKEDSVLQLHPVQVYLKIILIVP